MIRTELYDALVREMDFPAAEWDNDGVMCLPCADTQVARVLCTLDVTDAVVECAVKEGFDLILSHHPLLFSGIKAVTPMDPTSAALLRLITANIAVFSFHTRFDGATGGVNDGLCDLLGLIQVSPLGEGEAAMGRVGSLPSPLSFGEFTAMVKEKLGAPVLCGKWLTDTVRRVAVVGGEGKDFISDAYDAGADVYLSGRLGYHAMLDAPLSVLEMGHYYSERHAALLLAEKVKRLLPGAETKIYTPNLLATY